MPEAGEGSVRCRLCNGVVEQVLDLGELPIANQLQAVAAADVERFPLVAGVCTTCSLMQLMHPIAPEYFYTNYATLTSWKAEPHRARLIELVRLRIGAEDPILDVGCNDGLFLAALRDAGFCNLVGIEPTANGAEGTRARGLDVVEDFLDESAAQSLVSDRGTFACVTLRQVLEHVSDLPGFVEALWTVLAPGGLLVIEVPDSRVNRELNDYGLWEEHVNYFTPATLSVLLERQGFRSLERYTSQFSGTCLTVVAQRPVGSQGVESHRDSSQGTSVLAVEREGWVRWGARFRPFAERVCMSVSDAANGGVVALYGVGARSINVLGVTGLSSLVGVVIDDQPEKQGLFIPGTSLEVRPLEEAAILLQDTTAILLGVNTENESKVLARLAPWSKLHVRSVLPPSEILVEHWLA